MVYRELLLSSDRSSTQTALHGMAFDLFLFNLDPRCLVLHANWNVFRRGGRGSLLRPLVVLAFACLLLPLAVVAEQAKPDPDPWLTGPSRDESEDANAATVAHSADDVVDVELNTTVENSTTSNAVFICILFAFNLLIIV